MALAFAFAVLGVCAAAVAQAKDTSLYLNGGTGGESQVLVEFQERGHPIWGLGHASSGMATLSSTGVQSFSVGTNMRTLNFSGTRHTDNPIVSNWDALSIGDDPILTLSGNGTGNSVTVSWRQQTLTVPATVTVTEDPSNEYAIVGEFRHSYLLSISAAVDLEPFHISSTIVPGSGSQMHLTALLRFLDAPALPYDAALTHYLIDQDSEQRCSPLSSQKMIDEIAVLRCGLRYEHAPFAAALTRFGIDAQRLQRALPARESDPTMEMGSTSDYYKSRREYDYLVNTLGALNAAHRGSRVITIDDVVAGITQHPDDRLAALATSLGIALAPAAVQGMPEISDVTDRVSVVGRAFSYVTTKPWVPGGSSFNDAATTFSNNVWDIVPYGSTLFLTSGNKQGGGEPPGVPGIYMLAYDTTRNTFHSLTNVLSQQFRGYRQEPDGTLLFPSIEATGSQFPHNGNETSYVGIYYRYGKDGWKQFSIPDVIHTYDVADAGHLTGPGDTIYAALGTMVMPGSVGISHDGGKTWNVVGLSNPEDIRPNTTISRARHIFQLGGHWYASMNNESRRIYRIDGDSLTRESVNLFPDADNGDTEPEIVERDMHVNGGMLYIGADNTYDHQWEPFGLYFATAIDRARAIPLPVAGVLPYDIKIVDGVAYVLGSAPAEGGGYRDFVFTSADEVHWKTAFTFKTTALTRSFAVLQHGKEYYFGLGGLADQQAPDAGLLLHLRL